MNIVDQIRLRAHRGVSTASDAQALLREIDRLTGESSEAAHQRVQAASQIEEEHKIAYILETQLTRGGPMLTKLRAALAKIDAADAADATKHEVDGAPSAAEVK
jgi:hypothetical protein